MIVTHLVQRRVVWLAVLLVVGVGIGYALKPAPVTVEVAIAGRGPLRVTVDEEGLTRARAHEDLSAPTSGRYIPAGVRAGDSVSPGAIVGRLFPVPLDPRSREQARAHLRAAEAAEREAAARVEQARTRLAAAQRELGRAEQLARSGQLPQRDLDQARTAVSTSEGDLDAAWHRQEAARSEVESARAALVDAAATNTGTRPPLTIRSPLAGRVLRVHEEHSRSVTAGTPLLEVGTVSALEVTADVLSRDAMRISPGAPMLVDAGPGADSLRGYVRRVDPSAFTKISPLGVEEQRVRVTGDLLDHPPALGDQFRVDVHIVVWEGADVLQVPTGALFRDGSRWALFAVQRGRAVRRTVQIGQRTPRAVQILDGIAPGDTVILYPSDRVNGGARVRASRYQPR